MRIIPMITLLPIVLLTASACGSGGSADEAAAASAGIRVDPASALVERGGTVALTATVTGVASTKVKWIADCGTISEAGVFSAPQRDGVCRVTATSETAGVSATALVDVGVGGWAARCAAEPEPTSNVVYVCDCQPGADAGCVAGNDANAGTKDKPYRTWNKIQQAWRALPAGGTVALCKGGRWIADNYESNEFWTWRNTNCSASQPCTLRDYGPSWGGTSKPTLANSVGINVINFWPEGDGSNGGYRILNLRLYRPDGGKTLSTFSANGIRAANRIHDVEVCNCDIDGFSLGIYVGGASVGVNTPCTTSNWKIRGNRILNSCTHGIFGNFSNSDIDGNYWDNNGHAMCGSTVGTYGGGSSYWPLSIQTGGTTHTMYLNAGSFCSMDNVRVINNEVYRNAMTDVAGYGANPVFSGTYYTQAGGALKFVAGGRNFLFENNFIDAYPGHPTMGYTAISTNNQSDPGIHFDGFVVRRNRITRGGPHTGLTFKDVVNLVVEDNTLDFTPTDVNPFNEQAAIEVGVGSETTRSQAVVRNNTIYVNGPAGWDGPGVRIGAGAAAGQVVTGNSINVAAGNKSACIRVDDLSKIVFMNNNQCSGFAYYGNASGTNRSLADWQAATGFDTASITPALAGLFVNAPTDLTPAAGAPLVNAGSTAICTVAGQADQPCSSMLAIDPADVVWGQLETARVRTDGVPDIGAIER